MSVAVSDPFMADVKPTGLQKGRGGFLRSADDAPYVSDPSGDLVQSGARKGEVKRVKYGSPSGVGRLIENDVGLTKYKQRLTLLGIGMDTALAEACRDLVVMDAGSDEFRQAADRIAVQADSLTRSWLAADRGSHGHLICERCDREETITEDDIAAGQALGIDRSTTLGIIVAWGEMLLANGLRVLAIEAPCVDDRWRLAGTLDRIVRLTRDLRFVMPGGEVVTIPAGTVLILDIKFGQIRRAHLIQCASYDQSVPYDTDLEQRGVWLWELSHQHALIAHGDFGDDTRPVSIELVYIDLVAGREHGGETVAMAKSWAKRDDLWSVAQLEVAGGVNDSADSSRTLGDTDVEGENESATKRPELTPSTPVASVTESTPVTVTDAHHSHPSPAGSGAIAGGADPSPAPPATSPIKMAVRHSDEKWPYTGGDVAHFTSDLDRLALVDARASLCPSPDEGADWSIPLFGPVWDALKHLYDQLDSEARTWRAELAGQAKRRGVDLLAQGGKTERRYHLNRAVIALAIAGDRDDILRELLAHIVGDVALFPAVEPGHVLGSLSAVEAERFARHVDLYLTGPKDAA